MSRAPSSVPGLDVGAKKHFLFDLDGTLVDSSKVHEKAYRLALGSYSTDQARDFDYEPAKGRRTIDVFRSLGVSDAAKLAELVEAKQIAYRSMVARGEVELFDGALALLKLLAATGRTSFLATGASRRSTDEVLRSVGIESYFKGTVTADDVTRGKPNGECFELILRRWSLPPAECLVVEDAENGVAAAHAAGIILNFFPYCCAGKRRQIMIAVHSFCSFGEPFRFL